MMNPKNLAPILLLVALGACKKQEDDGKLSPGVTSTTSENACAPFVEKLTAMANRPAGPDEKKMLSDICNAISPDARKCAMAAGDKKALDKCLEPEGDKIKSIALAGAKARSDKAASQPSVAKLAKLGVALDVVGEAEISDGVGKDSQMFGSPSTGMVIVSEVPGKSKKTLATAKKDAAELFKAKNLQSGTLATGYWVSYENTGSAGKNYFVEVQHDVGKRTVRCESTSDSPEKAAAALTACKSLRAN